MICPDAGRMDDRKKLGLSTLRRFMKDGLEERMNSAKREKEGMSARLMPR